MTEPPAIRPQDQIVYLLGELKGQMTALTVSNEQRELAQSATNTELRAEVNRAHQAALEAAASASEAHAAIALVSQKIPTRTSWWQIAGGMAGIAAIILATIAVLPRFIA